MGGKKWQPFKYGIFFGVGIILYVISFAQGFTEDPGVHILTRFCLLISISYLYLVIVSFVSIFINNNLLGKRLKIAGLLVLSLSFLFLLAQREIFFRFSIFSVYASVSLSMLGVHYNSSVSVEDTKYIGLISAVIISFIGIIHNVIRFYQSHFEHVFYLFLMMAVLTGILCILSGYHSYRMLSEVDNHD